MSVIIPPRAANAYINENLTEVFWHDALHKRLAHEIVSMAAQKSVERAKNDDTVQTHKDFATLVQGIKEAAKDLLRGDLEAMFECVCEEIDGLHVLATTSMFSNAGFVDGNVLIDTVKTS